MLIAESPGQLGIGGKVWDAALTLVRYLRAERSTLLEGRRVLELGAGTGIVGMCCALLGASEVCGALAKCYKLPRENLSLYLPFDHHGANRTQHSSFEEFPGETLRILKCK